jgi:hypothetical protein
VDAIGGFPERPAQSPEVGTLLYPAVPRLIHVKFVGPCGTFRFLKSLCRFKPLQKEHPILQNFLKVASPMSMMDPSSPPFVYAPDRSFAILISFYYII